MKDKKLKITEKEYRDLYSQRTNFIQIISQMTKAFGPSIFKLKMEERINLRNVNVIAGALATFGLYLSSTNIGGINNNVLKISIIGFLLTILFTALSVHRQTDKEINIYISGLKKEKTTAERGLDIIHKRMDGLISCEEAQKALREVYMDIEYKHIRKNNCHKQKRGSGDKESKIYIFDCLIYLFVVSLLAMIFSFLIPLLI